ncbi:MAG: 3'-5' exonuclease [Prolixibacteraceae bacterium]|jgi:DNA polymerase-3 subunit epsilon|nr:3'-5' exonuclease [Prolixibacteraceae bacterium]
MYAVIDIETNGGNRQTGKITEIAVFIFDGYEIIESFTTLINPESHIPQYITELTGISNQMVANAPKFYEIAKKIVEITENRVFVAHNVSFDYSFIQKEFKELGYNYTRKKLCTVKLSRKYLPGHSSYSLGKICDKLNIAINGRHRAAGDAQATVELLKRILEQQKTTEPTLF